MFASLMPKTWLHWGAVDHDTEPQAKPRRRSSRKRFWAKRSAQSCSHHGDRRLRRIIKRLRLNDEQQTHLETLLQQLLTLRGKLQAQRSRTNHTMRALLTEPQLDQQHAMTLVRDTTRQIDEQAAELIMALAAFSDSLDSEQRETLLRWLDKRLGRRWRI